MDRRTFLAAVGAGIAAPALGQNAAARTLRVIPAAALTSLDPIWTTAPQTKNHGYLVYDQIASVDAAFVPRPQMAEGWLVEDDGRSWTFALRPGLRFHDGEPVRSTDCVASIRRWWARDGFGQSVASATDELAALDDTRFRFRMKGAFPLLAAALGKSNSSQCFIMPERIAATDPNQPIKDATGSGPFRFIAGDWVIGARAAYAKFDGYVPRNEPPSGIAGGRVAKVDRLEWTVIPDGATASAAMRTGEQDYWESPLPDLLPQLRADRNLVVETRDPTGTYMMLRFNHLQPPFDNPALRRAVALAINQRDSMQAVAGDDPKGYGSCYGFFACGTPLGTEAGGDFMRKPDLAKAKAAVEAAGYKGEKVVVIVATDSAAVSAVSEVTADVLRKLGMNVDYVATDWGTMLQRRNSQEPVDKGGWSIFHTAWNGADILNPAVNTMIRASGKRAWFGWPSDPEIEALRAAFLQTSTVEAAKPIAAALSEEAFRSIPYVPLGYYVQPHVWRRTVTGVFQAPTTVYWNIVKDS